jgi:hypothetical protein
VGLRKSGINAQWSVKPVHDSLANISDDKWLVTYITSVFENKIIKKISFYTSNNTFIMYNNLRNIHKSLLTFNIINSFSHTPHKQIKQKKH